VLPEQQIRVSEGRFRIANVCVISRNQPGEPVFTKSPLICVEILSKDDTMRNMQDRIDDYVALGVPNI
jgi:Uma2 family endonuclease